MAGKSSVYQSGGSSVDKGVRSPMNGFEVGKGKSPSLDGSGGGTVIVGSSPKSAPIRSPLDAPVKKGK